MIQSLLLFILTSTFTMDSSLQKNTKPTVYPALNQYLEKADQNAGSISPERKKDLLELAAFISTQSKSGKPTQLTFICTHNSRRSHFGQVWAATAAIWLGIEKIKTFSGGTEATACNPRTISALERAGFQTTKSGESNPKYAVSFADGFDPLLCFSKKYNDPGNPASDFAAIMTCSHADQNCPIIPGASARISIPYEDPKVSDNSPDESKTYDDRSFQIATEMVFVMKEVAKR
jgi:protein-tyrosine-phosphatase